MSVKLRPTQGNCWWWGSFDGAVSLPWHIYAREGHGLYAIANDRAQAMIPVDAEGWVWEGQVLTPADVQALRDEKWHAQSSVFKLHAQHWTDKAKALRANKEWKAVAVPDDGWFSEELGAIHMCVDCDALVAGGRTQCSRCEDYTRAAP